MLWTTRREERLLARGAYEPETFVERRNWGKRRWPARPTRR